MWFLYFDWMSGSDTLGFIVFAEQSTVLEAGWLISGVYDALMSLHDGVSERE